jgi:hypothetical protein
MRRSRQFWKPVVVAVLVTAVLACLVTDIGSSVHSDLACGLLPFAGSLDILPSGPGHWLTAAEIVAVTVDPLLASVSPRGPPA